MVKDDGTPLDDNGFARVDGADPTDLALEDEDYDHVPPPLLPSRNPQRAIFKAIGLLEQAVATFLLFLILILVLSLVAQRYLKGGWPATGEIARYSLVWATFVLAGYLVAYHPYHISIQVIDLVARGRVLAAIKLFVDVVILATSLVVMYGGFQLLANDIGQVTPAAGIPLLVINSMPLIGFSLVALRAVLGLVVRDVPALLGRSEAA